MTLYADLKQAETANLKRKSASTSDAAKGKNAAYTGIAHVVLRIARAAYLGREGGAGQLITQLSQG